MLKITGEDSVCMYYRYKNQKLRYTSAANLIVRTSEPVMDTPNITTILKTLQNSTNPLLGLKGDNMEVKECR
jgi:hypothetical protein